MRNILPVGRGAETSLTTTATGRLGREGRYLNRGSPLIVSILILCICSAPWAWTLGADILEIWSIGAQYRKCKIWHVGSNGVGLTLSTLDRMDASSISRLQSLAVSSCWHIAHRAKSARRSITWGGSVHAMARAASSMRPRRSVFLAHSIYTVDAQSIGMLAAHPRAPVLPTAITVRWSTRTVPIY